MCQFPLDRGTLGANGSSHPLSLLGFLEARSGYILAQESYNAGLFNLGTGGLGAENLGYKRGTQDLVLTFPKLAWSSCFQGIPWVCCTDLPGRK